MAFSSPGLPIIGPPPLGFRFGVVFLMAGNLPNPIDMRFQSVSGIGARLEVKDIGKNASNRNRLKLPQEVQYENLSLKRGLLVGSPLSMLIEEAFEEMSFSPVDVLVSVLSETLAPVKIWQFFNACPVSWSISGIDANQNDVLIEDIELQYSRFSTLSL